MKTIKRIFSRFFSKKTSSRFETESRNVINVFTSTIDKLSELNSDYLKTVSENQKLISEKELENNLINKTMENNNNIVNKINSIIN